MAFAFLPFIVLLLHSIGPHFTIAAQPNCSSSSLAIHIGVLLPEPYRRRIEPWLQLALQHIQRLSENSSPPFLSGHCVQLAFKDTECRASLGMKALFDLMGPTTAQQHNGQLLALFGDICTEVNEPVAQTSKYWTLVHLSFSETHAKFGTDSKELYPTFFRMAPGERNMNWARKRLILAFDWRRVGSIKQTDHSSLALAHERLTTQLEQNGVQVIYTASLSSKSDEHAIVAELDELKSRDVHIIVADLSQPLALRVLCAAYSRQLFGTDFVWILPGFQAAPNGSVRPQWWRDGDLLTNCSLAQLGQVLEGHFALDQALMRPLEQSEKSALLVGGNSMGQVLRDFRRHCVESGHPNCEDQLLHSAYAYDGIWALALALNQTLVEGQPLDKNRLLANMRRANFQGLSGYVRFDESGERLGLIQIQQWINGSYSSIGFMDSADGEFQLRKNNRWTPPPDSTLLLRRREYVSALLLLLMCTLALAGICLALVFLVFNVKYRNHRFIKMSSPNMNNLIIIGSLCSYLTIFLLSIDTRVVSVRRYEQICYAKIWILCFGFTLAFGSMFSKTYRVHSIFTNIRRDKKAIRDSKLYLIVSFLLFIDGALLLLWALVSPFRLLLNDRGQFKEENRLIIPVFERCESEYSLAFQLIFIIFKGLLMLFGCFLAWETRAVNVPALNDSKYIGIAVYAVVVLSALGLALAFILQEHLNEAFAISSLSLFFITTLTLCLVFVPKVVELWRTPKGMEQQRLNQRKGMMKSVVGKAGGSKAGGGNSVAAAIGATHEGLNKQLSLISAEELARRSAQLESENLRLHQTLAIKSSELFELLERVRQLTEQFKDGDGSVKENAVPPDQLKGNAKGVIRRKSARLFTSMAHQLLRRTKTSNSNCL